MSAYCTLWAPLDSKSLQCSGSSEAFMLVSLYFFPHFIDQETKAHGLVTFTRPHNQSLGELTHSGPEVCLAVLLSWQE